MMRLIRTVDGFDGFSVSCGLNLGAQGCALFDVPNSTATPFEAFDPLGIGLNEKPRAYFFSDIGRRSTSPVRDHIKRMLLLPAPATLLALV
jgi:hypothetical protein